MTNPFANRQELRLPDSPIQLEQLEFDGTRGRWLATLFLPAGNSGRRIFLNGYRIGNVVEFNGHRLLVTGSQILRPVVSDPPGCMEVQVEGIDTTTAAQAAQSTAETPVGISGVMYITTATATATGSYYAPGHIPPPTKVQPTSPPRTMIPFNSTRQRRLIQ